MTEQEIISVVTIITDIANSNTIETPDGIIHPKDLRFTFKISQNVIEPDYKFRCSLDNLEGGAIIEALLTDRHVKHILKEYAQLPFNEPLYLHYLAVK